MVAFPLKPTRAGRKALKPSPKNVFLLTLRYKPKHGKARSKTMRITRTGVRSAAASAAAAGVCSSGSSIPTPQPQPPEAGPAPTPTPTPAGPIDCSEGFGCNGTLPRGARPAHTPPQSPADCSVDLVFFSGQKTNGNVFGARPARCGEFLVK